MVSVSVIQELNLHLHLEIDWFGITMLVRETYGDDY
jgi:hypothetical protein